MFPSDLLSVQFFKTCCNTSYTILLGKFARFKLIRFNDSSKLMTDSCFSMQELEIITLARDNQNKKIVIHINITTINNVNMFLQHFGDDQIMDLKIFTYTFTTIY